MALEFDPDQFEEIESESESVTSGSEYKPSDSNKSASDSDDFQSSDECSSFTLKKSSLSHPMQIESETDSDISARSYTTKAKKGIFKRSSKNNADSKNCKLKCIKNEAAKNISKNQSSACVSNQEWNVSDSCNNMSVDHNVNMELDLSDISEESRFSANENVDLSGAESCQEELDLDPGSSMDAEQKLSLLNKKLINIAQTSTSSPNASDTLANTSGNTSESGKFVSTANDIINSSNDHSFDISLDINVQPVGSVLKNKFSEVVSDSKSGCKRNCCFYCLRNKINTQNPNLKILFTKLVDHYETAHSKEELIVELMNIPKEKRVPGEPMSQKAQKRLRILDSLRLKANHINNLQATDAKNFVVTRRPNPKFKYTVSSFQTCLKCHRRLSRNSAHKHVKKCTNKKSFKKHRVIRSSARATDGDYHKLASEEAIGIISVMQEKLSLNEIRYDKAVFLWLNSEASKYELESQKHNHKRVRASIGRLGTLLNEIKKYNRNIKEISDIFNENYYDDFIKAVKVMGKPHPKTGYMQAPATANDMFNLIKKVSGVYDVNIGNKDETKRLQIQAFERKLNLMWHSSIGNTIGQTQAKNRRNVVKQLPKKDDLLCLRQYLEEEITKAFLDIQEKYSHASYEKLRNALLTYLQFTNCRRPGEVERMELIDFRQKQSENGHYRIQVRGKRSRAVPVVFEQKVLTCLDWLILCRSQAEIHADNPYVFANIQDVSTRNFSCVSGCKLMKDFSRKCGAENPETLRATLCRMQLATDQMEKGIDEIGVEKLSGYMGHTSKIHRQNYRQSVVKRDIEISKKVQESQGINNKTIAFGTSKEDNANHRTLPDEDSNFNNDIDPDGSIFNQQLHSDNNISYASCSKNLDNDLVSHAEVTDDPVISTTKKTKKRTRKHDTGEITKKKLPWLPESISALLHHFPNALNLEYKVPSAHEITAFLDATDDPILKLREEPSVRVWMHSQRNTNKPVEHIPERNTIPGWIYSSFEKYIAAKKKPSIKTCAMFLSRSPSKSNITINNIQAWVQQAIRRKSDEV